MESQLLKLYNKKAVPDLMADFGYKNVMQVPKIIKVSVNIGYGKHVKDKNYIEHVDNTLRIITGQKPVHNKAKKSISNFKIRAGMPVGASVTLRGRFMYEFLYRLIHLALPRVRDFRGVSKSAIDKQGNYSLGIKEQLAFPEITAEMSELVLSLEVNITTTAKTKEEGLALLDKLGFPFKK
jgi:large subunit ribosomal protein L5